jgi:hypothetical protein
VIVSPVVAGVGAAPLLPAGGLGALGLTALLGTFLAIAMMKVWKETFGTFLRHLADWIDIPISVPIHGPIHPLRRVSHLIRAADQQVMNAFGWVILHGENAASWCFSRAGEIFWLTVHEFADLAHDLVDAVQRTTVQTIPASIRKAEAATLARLRGIDHAIGRLEAQAKAQLKRLQVGIDRMGHRLESSITHAIHGVGARVGRLERTAKADAKHLARLDAKWRTRAFAAAVGIALTRLGLNWLHCPALGRAGKKIGCKGFGLLDDLLALSFDAILLSDLCALTTLMTKAAHVAAPVIDHLAEGISGLIRCQNASRPRALSVKWSAPPPVANSLEL